MTTLLAVLACTLVLGSAPIANAQDEPEAAAEVAKKHFFRGEKLFALGRFGDALAAYEAAFEAQPLPEFLFNIGQCYRNLGNYRSAMFSFRKYLKLRPEAANRDAVLALIRKLEAELAEANSATAVPTADPPAPPAATARSSSKPIYRQWWFWTGIAAVAVGTGAVVVWETQSDPPSSDLGNVPF